MNTNELEAVALLLQNRHGYVQVFADGSALWSETAAEARDYPFPDDCPAQISCAGYSYPAARNVYRNAIKLLRNRGIR